MARVLAKLEDNQTTATIRTGKFTKSLHIQRMHGVNIHWLYEGLQRGIFDLEDCHTQRVAADIFAKHVAGAEAWRHAVRLLGYRHADYVRPLQKRIIACACVGLHEVLGDS